MRVAQVLLLSAVQTHAIPNSTKRCGRALPLRKHVRSLKKPALALVMLSQTRDFAQMARIGGMWATQKTTLCPTRYQAAGAAVAPKNKASHYAPLAQKCSGVSDKRKPSFLLEAASRILQCPPLRKGGGAAKPCRGDLFQEWLTECQRVSLACVQNPLSQLR